jgi:hypothetical protein
MMGLCITSTNHDDVVIYEKLAFGAAFLRL